MRISLTVAGLVLLVLVASNTRAQKYPAKPIRIVTAEADGVSNMVSRMIGQGLNASWGKAVVVYPGVAAKLVQELIALAKAAPGKLNYDSAALGTATQHGYT